jgi:hypothetical protein
MVFIGTTYTLLGDGLSGGKVLVAMSCATTGELVRGGGGIFVASGFCGNRGWICLMSHGKDISRIPMAKITKVMNVNPVPTRRYTHI